MVIFSIENLINLVSIQEYTTIYFWGCMELRPEHIKHWKVVEIESVEKKAKELFLEPRQKLLKDVYDRLKSKLTTYPPDQKYFSNPRMDLQSDVFWVKSENGQILVRAKYFPWAETCVIDKFYLAHEKPSDLDL